MLRLALGVAALLQAGSPSPAERGGEQSAVGVDCPSESVGEDCTADEVVVPAPAAVAPAPPAVAAPAATAAAQTPTAFATVSFRNDVGKKLRLVEAQFNLDGDKLPVVLTSAEPGKRYVILSGSVKPGQHIVSARLTYRGDRGLFTYMKGYKLHVRSDQVVTTPSNHTVNLTVVGSEARGMTVPLEKRVVITVEDGLGQHQSTSQK